MQRVTSRRSGVACCVAIVIAQGTAVVGADASAVRSTTPPSARTPIASTSRPLFATSGSTSREPAGSASRLAQPGGVCGNGNDCCASYRTPGCSDVDCCNTVCAVDPFCCTVAWDGICAGEAASLCGKLCGGGGECGAVQLSHSTAPELILPKNTAECVVVDQFSLENGLARSFEIPASGLTVQCVRFGIQSNVGGPWDVFANLYVGNIECPEQTPKLIGQSLPVTIPDNAQLALFDATFPEGVFVPGGTSLIVELFTPSRAPEEGGVAGFTFFGSNDQGETAPGYIRAPGCGVPSFVPFADIGFPNTHLVMTVLGSAEPVTCPARSGSCYEAHDTPGCEVSACCMSVCAADPTCCALAWDTVCVNLAVQACTLNPTGACCFQSLVGGPFTCTQTDLNTCNVMNGQFTAGAPCSAVPCATCAPPPTGMTGWWPLDETSGSIAHELVASKNGSITPSAATGPQPTAGKVGGAFQFDGLDDVIHVPHSTLHNAVATGFTLDAWVFWNGPATPCSLVAILEKEPTVSGTQITSDGYALVLDPQGILLFYAFSSASATNGAWITQSTSNVPGGQWVHVAVTIDPAASTQHVQMYINGLNSGGGTAFWGPTLLSNGPLTFGFGTIGYLFEHFSGALDEIEIFQRPLSAYEIYLLWLFGSAGKCKDICHAPWEAPCCGAPTVSTNLTICNWSATSQNYSWTAVGVAPGGPQCQIAGPSVISPSSAQVTVGPMSCVQIPVTMDCPSDAAPGAHGCFDFCVTNLATGVSRCCRGSVVVPSNQWKFCLPIDWATCPFVDGSGFATTVAVEVSNLSDPISELPYRIDAMPSDMLAPEELLSLNGLPPGEPVFGTLLLAPGRDGAIEVSVSALALDPFLPHDLVFSADTDHDGVYEAMASVGVQVVLATLGADLNGDGSVNAIDLGVLLGNWGGSGIGDIDGSGVVDAADLAQLLGAWS